MKKVIIHLELTVSNEILKSKEMQELINEIKCGAFQKEIVKGNFNTGGKVHKCTATVQVK